jgi:UDP-N-acetyl-D-mannosaminuronic acid dehydrogenase
MTAEMIKLTSNVYRDVIFGFSNEISRISYNYDLNPNEIITACNLDYPRCNIFSSGPVAGPCLTKDSYILSESDYFDSTNSIIHSARKINETYILNILNTFISKIKSACILGIAFKGTPSTSDTRDSYALKINRYLKSKNIKVYGYDPLVYSRDFIKYKISKASSIEDSFKNKDLIIIQNNNEIFKQLDLNYLSSLMNKNGIILDLWSLYSKPNCNNIKYINL